MSHSLICTTCGTQYPPNQPVPEFCTICSDDRQYINENGQNWISFGDLKDTFKTQITQVSRSMCALRMYPDFALANRALLVQSPGGNILWDCIPLPDSQTVDFINSIGGLKAIAFSHPHYYSTMNEWAKIFNCLVYIHEADKEWVMYPTDSIKFWAGDSLLLWDRIQLFNTGGHFPGSSVLHLPSRADDGTVLCGDTMLISRSKRHTAVMYSYPNQILLTREAFASFYQKISAVKFSNLYGAFDNQDLVGNAYQIFTNSMERYRTSYGLNH